MKECTFTPDVAVTAQKRTNPEAILRLHSLHREKQLRLERAKGDIENEEMNKCPFVPQILTEKR